MGPSPANARHIISVKLAMHVVVFMKVFWLDIVARVLFSTDGIFES
jgi:hypothetical protein